MSEQAPEDLIAEAEREEQKAEDLLRRVRKVACPHCGSWFSKVTEGREDPRGYKRWRKCDGCQHTFHTLEKIA